MRWIWSEEHMSEIRAKVQSVCAAATPSPLPPRGGRVGDGGEMALYLIRWACPSAHGRTGRSIA